MDAFIRNAHDVAQLLGIPPEQFLLYHGFVSHDVWPLIHNPTLDAYLVRMGACWSHGATVRVLTTPLLPGVLEEHFLPLGITPHLHAFHTNSTPRAGDAVRNMLAGGHNHRDVFDGKTVFASFVTEGLAALARCHITHKASRNCNSKARMRERAREFGFLMPPGQVVRSMHECRLAGRTLRYPLWVKTDGSGGDFGVKVRREDALEAGVRALVRKMLEGWDTLPPSALSQEHTETMQLYNWRAALKQNQPLADELVFPMELVVEEDASVTGEVLANVCWQWLVTARDQHEIGASEQSIGPSGEWWGSTSRISPLMRRGGVGYRTGLPGAHGICAWMRAEGLTGLMGPDGFLVRRHDTSKLEFLWIDPNGRPAMSTTSFILLNALMNGRGVFLNTNLTLPRPVTHWQDVTRAVGEELVAPGGCDGVQGVLLSSRTEPETPSAVVKMFFGARDTGFDFAPLLRGLEARGVKIGS